MRRILVTGGNKGIGLAIITAILGEHDDTFVFLGSRDLGRGQAARDALTSAQPRWAKRLDVIELDVASDASVRGASNRIRELCLTENASLYCIVNNDGIGGGKATLASVFGVKLSGFAAWFVWRSIYLSKMPGLGRKVRVALDWTLDLLFPRDYVSIGAHNSASQRAGRE